MKSGTYIIIVIISGFALIGYLFAVRPEAAPTQLPLILAAVGGLVAVLGKLGDTDAKVAQNTIVTETTHEIVNSQRTEMLKELAKLRKELAEMRTAKAAEETSESRIIAAVAAGPDSLH